MSAKLFYLPFRPAIDASGIIIPGAELWFYAAGGSTLQSAYSDEALTIPLSNPVVATAAGAWPAIYLNEGTPYKVVLKDSDGATVAEQDPYLADVADALTADLQAVADAVAANAAAAAASKTDAESEADAAALSATNAANSSLVSADIAQFLLVLGRYYPVITDGVAATAVGDLFSSDQSGSLLVYKHIGTAPYYSVVSSASAVTSVNASGGTTGMSFSGGPITSAGTLTLAGTLAMANGGTGATTATAARSNLAAAKSGANSDITSLSGLTTALPIAQGGTGATTAAAARAALGAASTSEITGLMPAGAVQDFAMTSPPTGWLECDGSAVSRSTYSDLFSAIGTTWGAGDGSTTFNLPDVRGKFRRSWDHGAGVDSGRAFASSQAASTEGLYAKIRKQGSDDLSWSQITTPSWSSNVAISGDGSRSPDTLTTGTEIGSLGTGETRPVNVSFLTCIKT